MFNPIIFFKKLKKKQLLNKAKPYYSKAESSLILDNFNLAFYLFPVNRKYLQIDENSAVDGQFIFESKDGFISIGKNCWIGNSTFICNTEIIIEDNVTVAFGSTFYTHNSHSLDYEEKQRDITEHIKAIKNKQNPFAIKNWREVNSKSIRICKNAWIGMNCLTLKGVTIGEGSIVGAGSVVAKDVPAWSVVAGNPAKIMKMLETK